MTKKLAIFLNLGDSVETHQKSGQWERFTSEYLDQYSQNFRHVYIFSYGVKTNPSKLPQNCTILPNTKKIHRYLYTFLIPFLHAKELKTCHVSRTMQTTGGIPAIISQILYKIPAIVTYGYNYTNFAQLNTNKFIAFLTNIYTSVILNLATKIIVTTPASEKKLDKHKHKLLLIPNGVNTHKFQTKPNYRLHKPVRILSIGRLTLQKQYRLAISGLAKLPPKIKTQIKYTIIGNGELENELQQLAQRKKIKLEIIDQVPHSKIPSSLKSADIYLHTSVIEGHPKSLLEAMAVGLPCLVVNSSKHVYQFLSNHQNALFSEPSEKNIATNLNNMIKNLQTRNIIGKNASETIRQKFDLPTLIKTEISILNKIATQIK